MLANYQFLVSLVVTCPRLCPPSDGYVHNPDLKVGALAYYGCDSGFTGQGSWMRVCAENGSWVPIEPTCQPISKYGPLVKSAYQKNYFLVSQPKHMLCVLKRTVSMRRFF